MKTIIVELDSQKLEISLLSDDFRPKNVWVNRERTDEIESFDGKPISQVDAAVRYAGVTFGAVRLETTTVLENVPFGSVIRGSGRAHIRVSPKDAYSLSGSVFVEMIVVPTRPTRGDA